MKKIIFSNYTKVIAALLFVVFITSGILTAINGITALYNEDKIIYGFEKDFSETHAFDSLLHAPEAAVFLAFNNYANELDDGTRGEIQNGTVNIDEKPIIESLESDLNNLYCKEKVDYFLEINGTVFTNCGAENINDLTNKQFFYIVSRDSDGFVNRRYSKSSFYIRPVVEEISIFDKNCSVTIAVSIKDEYVSQCKAIWERQATILNNTVKIDIVFIVATLLILIYLLCVCGKNHIGEQKSLWTDNIWVEVHLIAIIVFGLLDIAVCIFLLEEKVLLQPFLNLVAGTLTAVASAVIINSLLSVVRNIKCKKIVERSIIIRLVRCFFKTALVVLKWVCKKIKSYKSLLLQLISKKSSAVNIAMFLIYTATIAFCGLCIADDLNRYDYKWLVFFALITLAACFVFLHRIKDLEDIKKGISEIRKGDLAYKIPEPKCSDLKAVAENLNDIAKGLDDLVSAKLKAERMKTELITNVSHDLKTPLTSIINYTELLSKIEGLPEDANDYIKVIGAKSDRLKTLTQDLFDISKVQSGNETVDLEKIDVSILINQTLGEYDGEIKNSNLTFCVEMQKELYIMADGKKMSRVVSNLMNNILKYSMKNTRVFINTFEKDGDVIMEFKNISSYPMNFSAEEIVGRFVRGDQSRTAEGNGLGLAIAQSYTELCGGQFEIIIDGDMFKSVLIFRKV